MAWSREQDERDEAAQLSWMESWAGWTVVPEAAVGRGWNELHQQGGGGFPDERPVWSDVPARFWDESPEAGPEAPWGFNADGAAEDRWA